MNKIVFDTNCLIQSIPQGSVYRKVWDSFFDGTNYLCLTNSILEEYEEILERLAGTKTARLIVLSILDNPYTLFFNTYYEFNLIEQDPDDNKFFDCAVAANAKYLVSDDRHFDAVKLLEFPHVDIIGLDDFLKTLQ